VLAQEAVRDETRFELTPDENEFLYMPFMHSESPVIHEKGLKLFSEVGLESHLAYEEGTAVSFRGSADSLTGTQSWDVLAPPRRTSI
jgi:hypothetical protein